MSLFRQFLFLLLWVPCFQLHGASKVAAADFEDIGTWRMQQCSGIAPGGWFAGDYSLSGTRQEAFRGNASGELRFAFDTGSPGPFRMTFSRAKMSLVDGFIEAIEFVANNRGLPVSLRFELIDTRQKKFTTVPVKLSGDQWKSYRIAIDGTTLRGFADCRFPVRLYGIILESKEPCEGRIFLDDITLVGDFAKKSLLSIAPIYDGISYSPDSPITLNYRIYNAWDISREADFSIEVFDFKGAQVLTQSQPLTLDANGETVASFNVGSLPIGAYSVHVTAAASGTDYQYDDMFCVIDPNNGRINQHPMWFGIADQSIWQGPDENALHIEWMRSLGVDLDRISLNPGRFEPQPGKYTYGPYANILKQHAELGIDVLALLFETPPWTQFNQKGRRLPPEDYDLFAQYCESIARFSLEHPNLTYVEVWNEPDIGFFRGDLEDYLAILKTTFETVKSINPQLAVATAGVTVRHPKEKENFSRDMFVKGAPYYDVAAFHAHGPLGNYIGRQEMLEAWLKAEGLDKPIGNTETGERSGYTAEGRAQQARALVKKITYAKARPASEFFIWFTLQDYWDMDERVDDSFGLVTSDNRAKPAFGAYSEIIRQLANTRPEGDVFLGEDICAYAFIREDGKRVYVLWPESTFTDSVLWLDASTPVQMTDMFGRSQRLDAMGGVIPVPVGQDPFYLEPFETEGGAKLLAAAWQRVFLRVSPELRMGKKGGPIQVWLRNPLTESMFEGTLNLMTLDGESLSQKPIHLEPDEEACFDLELRPEAMLSPAYTLILQQGENGHIKVALPVNPVLVYPVVRVDGNTMEGTVSVVLGKQEDVHELAFDPSIPPWGGSDDLSARIRFSHDDKNLNMRAIVTDDKYVQEHGPEAMWKGDSIQLAVGTSGNPDYTILTIGMADGEGAVWCHRNTDASLLGKWDIPVAVEHKGMNAIYDVSIPLERVNLTADAFPLPIRLAVLINEDDGQGRVRWMQWHDGIGKGQDIELLGRAELE